MKNDVIGRCIGETSLTNVSFVSKEMPKMGEYVTLKYDNKIILGMIESLVRGSVALNNDIYDPNTIERIKNIEGDDYYIKGNVKILGDIDYLKIPRTPAPPGTEIKLASSDVLDKIFRFKDGLKLGHLISNEDVEVNLNINKMVSRHLAILAMTGAGKSNTVSVIIDGLLANGGCPLIFDMHSEYVGADFPNGEVNKIDPIVNPLYLEFSEILQLANITGKSFVQERYFRKAFNLAKEELRKGTESSHDFIYSIRSRLESWYSDEETYNPKERNTIMDVINKLDDMDSKYSNLFNSNSANILSKIKLGMANIIDLGQVDENTAEVLVAHVLRTALKSRKNYVHGDKKALSFPVFFVLEEAHILAPNSRNTKCKYWVSRVAREGRKFGLGLCLVSQSPKSVDPDALSQANNMIILRLVEPKDQRHVQSASESLSDDLVNQLPSLNIGEALVLGLMTKVPTLVKIDEFKGRVVGDDIDVLDQWRQYKKDKEEELERQKAESRALDGYY
ncbi:ATPase [Methanobrevibacter sp. 87.7]|uniref:helicase HerA-like domain-containing protein n=1 Tax=Methanobrevibacter sp. 87.7 TaxID=387957 RepID=UPI000B4FECFC|nr:ATP-binding protein [Methanobrevibacter sp. 87.7]OWT32927.1 ATPase [Methanobrevibacter sp. 87.7]